MECTPPLHKPKPFELPYHGDIVFAELSQEFLQLWLLFGGYESLKNVLGFQNRLTWVKEDSSGTDTGESIVFAESLKVNLAYGGNDSIMLLVIEDFELFLLF